MVKRYLYSFALLACALAAEAAVLQQPAVSRPFFNPTLGQTVSFHFELLSAATVTVRVIDRDGFPVRTLASAQQLAAGRHTLTWDGRDDAKNVVADEAWSFRIDAGAETYFPGDAVAEMYRVEGVMYDRRTALLHYTLPVPSRIHLQAGVTEDAAKQTRAGAVMKTVVNRAPRPAGAVVEPWNGADESGTIRVAALPNFVVAVAATPLPENSVISVGSRGASFAERVPARSGASLFTRHPASHAHHQGLSTLDDITPRLQITVAKARQVDGDWHVESPGAVRLHCEVIGVSATAFAKQGGDLLLFVDGRLARRAPATAAKFTVDVEREHLSAGRLHIITVNWATPNGPTAANALRVHVAAETATR